MTGGPVATSVGMATKKYTVTLPEELAEEIRGEVGPGGISAYVTRAVERQREVRHRIRIRNVLAGDAPGADVGGRRDFRRWLRRSSFSVCDRDSEQKEQRRECFHGRYQSMTMMVSALTVLPIV